MPTDVTTQAFTIDEFCDRNAVGRTTTYEEIRAGRLLAKKIGSKTIIPADAERAWREALPDLKLTEAPAPTTAPAPEGQPAAA